MSNAILGISICRVPAIAYEKDNDLPIVESIAKPWRK